MSKKPLKPEDALQIAVAETLDYLGWLWEHPCGEAFLHGTKRERSIQMARMKQKGFKKGVPDVMIFEYWSSPCGCGFDCNKGHGIAIELKIKPNKATPEQKQWLADLKARGWLTAVCFDINEVRDLLRHVRPLNKRRFQG
jgi:hypothetical protein